MSDIDILVPSTELIAGSFFVAGFIVGAVVMGTAWCCVDRVLISQDLNLEAGRAAIPSRFFGTAMMQNALVDIALVVAMDCSSSVTDQEVAVQMKGLSLAFQREELKEAIQSGKLQRIAVCVLQWSGKGNQAIVVPWTVISSADEAERFAANVVAQRRLLEPTATSISSALLFADKLFDSAPHASRQVIDVSAEGPNNVGPTLRPVRDQLLQKGITINGLAVSNEWRNLTVYLETEMAGGDGHFVVQVLDYNDYADGIYRKLLRELTSPGMS